MTLNELLAVEAIVKAGSLAKAAEQLYISRSALSTTLHRIEQELGTPLFRRTTAGVALTQAGKEYLRYANTVIRLWKELECTVSSLNSMEKGVVSLGSVGPVFRFVLEPILRAFAQKYPGIRVDISDRSGSDIERALAYGELELALLHLPTETPGLSCRVVAREPLLIAAPVGHPLEDKAWQDPQSGRYYVSMKALQKEEFVLPSSHFRDRRVMDQVFLQSGVTPRLRAELHRYDSIFPYINATGCLSMGAYSICRAYRLPHAIRYYYIETCDAVNELALVSLAGATQSNAAQALEETIFEVIPTLYEDISQP